MPIRSMTGYAQARSITVPQNGGTAQTLIVSLKSVNHRHLDLGFRMPQDCDAIEMKLRRLLKEKMIRGHVDLTVSLERGSSGALQFDRNLVASYVSAFREAAKEQNLTGEPDLNALLRMPGAVAGAGTVVDEAFEFLVLRTAEEAIKKLNSMREEEGKHLDAELRTRMANLGKAVDELSAHRVAITRAVLEKVKARMAELIGGKADPDRILQEAAMLAERSDVEEELVRLKTHIQHFNGLLDQGAEVGKKLDFLLQELNREANTLLSKTSGVAGDGLRITELGLVMKSEIEKAREQVQNIE
jgi:uncharacterized protein (TIGR00255 family)